VRLAVDDFGHAASLSTLKQMALDALKIGPAFVAGIGSGGGTDMVAAIIHIARALGLRVLAEGVASEPGLAVLDELGCDQYQGELLSPPLQAAALLELLGTAARALQSRNHLSIRKQRGR